MDVACIIPGLDPIRRTADRGRAAYHATMDPQRINPESLPTPSGQYSMVSVASIGSHLALVSGQTGRYSDGTIADSPIEQCRQAFRNVGLACASIGVAPSGIMHLRTFLVGHGSLEAFVAARAEAFREWYADGLPPASTLLIVVGLADPVAICEIEATIVLD